MTPARAFACLALTAALPVLAGTPAARLQDAPALRAPDVFYVPTPPAVVDAMLEMAGVTAADVVYDLGCGDGRIPIAAAERYGARGVGIDIDPKRIAEARENAKAAGVADRVTFLNQDLFSSDISAATVVTLVPAAVAEREADPEAQGAQTRDAHRVARLRHGELVAAGAEGRGRGEDDLLLDDQVVVGDGLAVPVRVRRLVFHQPPVHELTVRAPPHLLALVEGPSARCTSGRR